jgi:hypothetical protein
MADCRRIGILAFVGVYYFLGIVSIAPPEAPICKVAPFRQMLHFMDKYAGFVQEQGWSMYSKPPVGVFAFWVVPLKAGRPVAEFQLGEDFVTSHEAQLIMPRGQMRLFNSMKPTMKFLGNQGLTDEAKYLMVLMTDYYCAHPWRAPGAEAVNIYTYYWPHLQMDPEREFTPAMESTQGRIPEKKLVFHRECIRRRGTR